MPERVTYVEDPIGFKHAFQSWSGPVGVRLRVATELVAVASRVAAPKRTGALSAGHVTSYGHTPGGDLESQIIAVPKHAKFVIKGTHPHVIRAHGGGRLVFFWPKVGHIVSFKSVNHPGNKADNYMLRSLSKVMKRFT